MKYFAQWFHWSTIDGCGYSGSGVFATKEEARNAIPNGYVFTIKRID